MDAKLLAVAGGQAPADLVVKNGKIVNVYTKEIYDGGVAVANGKIAAVGDVDYTIGEGTKVVDANGTGTCSGIKQALELIPENQPFMLVWSDLILPKEFELPEEYEDSNKAREDYIGISQTFLCRWSYKNNNLVEEASYEYGVAGFFLFTDKSKIKESKIDSCYS